MVYYSQSAISDLDLIFEGLLLWPKHNLEYNHVVIYHNELRKICDSLDTKTYHFIQNLILIRNMEKRFIHTFEIRAQHGI